MKNDKVYLTRLASAAGCGAKIGPKVLAQVVGKLPKFTDPMLLVGPETSDDAAVYKISDELAMIQTVDFFPPVVNDPYMYGQIAAANALSDVYAMGGIPKLALNVVAFPNCLGPEVLEQILRGGADKVMEAGAVLAGGHTINDKEPKYGLCVTGYLHPEELGSQGRRYIDSHQASGKWYLKYGDQSRNGISRGNRECAEGDGKAE